MEIEYGAFPGFISVLLEFEWVMRGYYPFTAFDVSDVFQHLLSLEQVMIEERATIQQTIANVELGFDFAGVLHHVSYKGCTTVAFCDDKKISKRAKINGLMP